MAEQTATTKAPDMPTIPAKKNFFTVLMDWPLSRQIAFGAVLLVSIAAFSVLIIQVRMADQQLLYAQLSATDAASITEWLKAQKIPYSLKDGGKSVWVPTDVVYQTRLDLAANDLPSGGGVGYEIFDKQSFALTDYVQKVNFTRALQGELARTITSLAPVESTRVHLAIPEKRLFKDQQKDATASVILNLVPGKRLSQDQVQGIINLVASSVSGLNVENVKVIDSTGVVLDSKQQSESDTLQSTDMLSFQRQIESQMEVRAQDLLEKTMGPDRAIVRVTATVDFSKVEKTEEMYDADNPVIRSEQLNNENSNTPTSGGVPGVQSNLQGNSQGNTATGPTSSKTARTTNYEISKTVSHTINPVGTVTKLSVSVLVADRQETNAETKAVTTVARNDAELESIKNMVSTAVGLVPARGDLINVLSLPFVEAPIAVAEATSSSPIEMLRDFTPLIKYGLSFLGLFAVYFFLVRPIMKTVKGEVKQHNKTVTQMEREQQRQQELDAIDPPPPVDIALSNIRQEVMKEHAPAAFIVKNWIQEG